MRQSETAARAAAAALVIYGAVMILSSLARLENAEEQLRSLEQQRDVLTAQADALRAGIEHGYSDEEIERLARERLGLVRRGELIFYFS